MSLAEFTQYYPIDDSKYNQLNHIDGLGGYRIITTMNSGCPALIDRNGKILHQFNCETKREILAELNDALETKLTQLAQTPRGGVGKRKRKSRKNRTTKTKRRTPHRR